MARDLENVSPEERTAIEAVLSQLFGAEQPMYTTTYRYDGQGRQVEKCTLQGGLGRDVTTREYDDHNNPTIEVQEITSTDMQADASGNLQPGKSKSFKNEWRYDYKYDSFGNWTERIVSVRPESNADFRPNNIERREIRYY
jgi:hypothetical protein